MRILKKILFILSYPFSMVFGAYIFMGIVAYYIQLFMAFAPTKTEKDFNFCNMSKPIEEVFISVQDSIAINGIYMRTDSVSKGLVFFSHGNAGNIAMRSDIANKWLEMGYDIFMWDYRGFGKSGGHIYSEEQFLSDADSVFKVATKGYNRDSIILHGRSMGTSVTSMLCSKYPVRVTLLECPYHSVIDMTDRKIPFMLFPSFIRHPMCKIPLRSDLFLEKAKSNFYIIHGTEDPVIPIESSLRLKEKFKLEEGDRYFTSPGGAHMNLRDFPEFDQLMDVMLKDN